MSSVSASASEYSELFGHDEETGEVQPSFDEDTGEVQAPFSQIVASIPPDATDHPTPADNPDPRPRSVNSFGHDRHNLDFAIAYPVEKGKGKMPAIIVDAIERLQNWAINPDSYPEFNDAICGYTKGRMRSQMREKVVRVLSSMLRRLSLATMIVGKPSPNGMRGWAVKGLSEVARVPRRGCEAVLTLLYRSELVSSAAQYRKLSATDTPYHGDCCRKTIKGAIYEFYASMRTFSVDFFKLLGFTEETIEKARKVSSSRIKEEAKKLAVTVAEMVKLKVEKLKGKKAKPKQNAEDKKPQPQNIEAELYRRADALLAAEIPNFDSKRNREHREMVISKVAELKTQQG
ncbi:hypothetical protein ACQ0P8_16220 (plasmid) [Halodesulfovibrio aestuarii]|uniref:Uncharacterized protein n=1 Tax=Halodesulfovibrio aestuarii TaxID=126333 RepID=A0A8G2CC64_9BACT|nr:hypothetical protein [Halodesulfovibrio aestuarii]SHJ72602.1 hypothetical protein SAMN05660830_03094 [Halodesulfovibrio aestuarii]